MVSARVLRNRLRVPVRIVRHRHVNRHDLGCAVVRRITDDVGRAWRVREFRSNTGVGLFFRCEVPGIRSETRAARVPIECIEDDRLVDLLQTGNE